MVNGPKIMIGCDPELFVFSKKKKRVVSAHNLIPGTKKNPHIVNCGAVQVDGVAAEFNIEPASTVGQFAANIAIVKKSLQDILDWQGRKDNDVYQLVSKPCVFFTKTYWATIPKEAKELGCEPDFDAYTMRANVKPDSDMLMRTGSGHIHISWGDKVTAIDDTWMDLCADLVKHLDHHLLPESKKWDKDELRQKLYGRPGAFRPKNYGVEYRVLSNAWLDDYRIVAYIYQTTRMITAKWLNNEKKEQYKITPYYADRNV